MNKDESGKQTSEKSKVKILNTNQSSVSKLNTEENAHNKLINGEAKRVTSFECKPESDEMKTESADKKLIKDNRRMHQTSQETSSSLQDSTRSYSEVNNGTSVNEISLTMTNNVKHEQSITLKENNRNPNTTNSKASSNKAEGIIKSSYDERKLSDKVIKRKKSSMAQTMSGGGRKVKLCIG
jgi:hypothetical protein